MRDNSELGRRRAAYRPRVERICSVCGRTFVAYVRAWHCSVACRSKAYRERRKVATGYEKRPERRCPVCGLTFRRGRNARYCTVTCKRRAARLQQAR